MSAAIIHIARADDLAAARRLGVACGLESGCEPLALTKRRDDRDPSGRPSSEGETWHDRD